jgi:hypothetical protein
MEPNLKSLTDYAESDVETMGAGMKGKVSDLMMLDCIPFSFFCFVLFCFFLKKKT